MTILLVRHAESVANLDETIFKTTGDHCIELSPEGLRQAEAVGKFIENYNSINNPNNEKVRLWASTYKRTTQTARGLQHNAPDVNWDISASTNDTIFFDDRLRERGFGLFDGLNDAQCAETYPVQWAHYQKMMQKKGRYYAKPYDGESGAIVSDRLRTFKETLWRDIAKGKKNHVIVNHGFTLRCFVTSFLNLHPDIFEEMKNPSNTAVRLLDIDPMTKRYADYGYIYDPKNNIYLTEKPAKPIRYEPVL